MTWNWKRTFRNCNNHECNSDNEDLNEGNTLLVGSAGRFSRPELNEEAYHEGCEQKETSQTPQLSDKFGQVVKFKLKRRILCVTSEGL